MARDSRTVDVHVSRVRRKLGPRYGQCLVTEYRVGYQFRPAAAVTQAHAARRNTSCGTLAYSSKGVLRGR